MVNGYARHTTYDTRRKTSPQIGSTEFVFCTMLLAQCIVLAKNSISPNPESALEIDRCYAPEIQGRGAV